MSFGESTVISRIETSPIFFWKMINFHFNFRLILTIVLFLNAAQSLTQTDCVCRLGAKKRIIGGEKAPPNYVPWQTALFYNGIFICGGIIINENYVASASHCVNHSISFDIQLLRIVVGSTSLKLIEEKYIYNVSETHNHPDFNSSRLSNGHDIAFVKLNRTIVFEKSRVEPACISFRNTSEFKELMVN